MQAPVGNRQDVSWLDYSGTWTIITQWIQTFMPPVCMSHINYWHFKELWTDLTEGGVREGKHIRRLICGIGKLCVGPLCDLCYIRISKRAHLNSAPVMLNPSLDKCKDKMLSIKSKCMTYHCNKIICLLLHIKSLWKWNLFNVSKAAWLERSLFSATRINYRKTYGLK